MNFGLKNKVAVVGGASSGIGFGCASILAGEGTNLVMVSLDSEKLDAAANKIRFDTGIKVLDHDNHINQCGNL